MEWNVSPHLMLIDLHIIQYDMIAGLRFSNTDTYKHLYRIQTLFSSQWKGNI